MAQWGGCWPAPHVSRHARDRFEVEVLAASPARTQRSRFHPDSSPVPGPAMAITVHRVVKDEADTLHVILDSKEEARHLQIQEVHDGSWADEGLAMRWHYDARFRANVRLWAMVPGIHRQ
jgi:hypothetical protein